MTYVRGIVPPHIHAARNHALPRHRLHAYTGVHLTSPALRAHRTHHTYPKTKNKMKNILTAAALILMAATSHDIFAATPDTPPAAAYGATLTSETPPQPKATDANIYGHIISLDRQEHIPYVTSIGQGYSHRHHGRRHGTLLSEESARRPMYHCRRSHRLLYGRAAGCNETQQDRRA